MTIQEAVQAQAKCIEEAPLSKATRLHYESALQQIVIQLNAADGKLREQEAEIQVLRGRLAVAEAAATGPKPEQKEGN